MFSSENPPKFTADHQKTLRAQTITTENPGTLVRDFETLLRFVSEREAAQQEIALSGVLQLLPLSLLRELNAQMVQPLDVKLKRPQSKSFPNLHGLYWLLRMSGLAHVDNRGKKALLRLDEAVHANWQKLNATEKYFTLLQSWLALGDESVIGEREMLGPLYKCFSLWKRDETAPDNASEHEALRYWPGLHNLALLELCGLVKITHGTAQEGEGWQIERVAFTPFGDAMFALLGKNQARLFGEQPSALDTGMSNDFIMAIDMIINEKKVSKAIAAGDKKYREEDAARAKETAANPFALWQPIFAPYFPDWRKNFALPAEEKMPQGVCVFKVLLDKDIWRRIRIPSSAPLDELSTAILDAFKFDDDHLYAFIFRDRLGREEEIQHPSMHTSPSTSNTTIGEVPLQVGEMMTYLFDFGDNWQFGVLLEKIDAPNARIKKARVLESHGTAPEQYYYEFDEDEDED